jgi:uroporphyrinogen-III synthase
MSGQLRADGLVKTIEGLVKPGLRVLRLRSDKAEAEVAEALRRHGALMDDCILYRNEPIAYEAKPDFDAVFFASASAVEVFDTQWGVGSLAGKTVAAIGKPTLAALQQRKVAADVIGQEATVESCLETLALHYVRQEMRSNHEHIS